MKNGEYILVTAPINYPGKKYRNKYCYEHHLIYWQHYGVIPNNNEIIHHIDGNKHNNNINNLKLLTKNQHDIYHNQQRRTHIVQCLCPTCGKIFERPYRQSHLVKHGKADYCSKQCAYKANTLRNKQDEQFLKRIKNNIICELYK